MAILMPGGAAGLGGLAVTAAFARPVLRARAHERGLSKPGAGKPDLSKPGAGKPDPGVTEQAGTGRRAGAA